MHGGKRARALPLIGNAAPSWHRAPERAEKVRERADRGELYLSDELKTSEIEKWVYEGVRQLGLLHEVNVLKIEDNAVWTEDLNLLYYYRNRLAGYGLSRLAEKGGHLKWIGQYDSQGFLA